MTGFDRYLENRDCIKFDEDYMREAILSAERAKSKGDYPIGAVLSMSSRYLAEHDTVSSEESPLNTASTNVLRKAFDLMPRKVADSLLYCTVEPNLTSVSAAVDCGVKEVVFGCYNLKDGWISSRKNASNLFDVVSYKGGVLAKECFEVLTDDMKDYCSVTAV